MLVGLVGCSGAEGAQSAPEAEEKAGTLKIAAASSLEYAFQDKLIPMYEKDHPTVTVEGTYDGSGKLQTQIEAGLEVDLFFSAATKQMDALVEEGSVDKVRIENILANKVVLITPKANPAKLATFTDIAKAASIAIGDPESVPAGQYAKTVLTKRQLWDTLTSRFSLGTNVTEVLNWVAEASAEAGIVYETDAKTTDKVTIIGEAPADSLNEPIFYPAAVVKLAKIQRLPRNFSLFYNQKKQLTFFATMDSRLCPRKLNKTKNSPSQLPDATGLGLYALFFRKLLAFFVGFVTTIEISHGPSEQC